MDHLATGGIGPDTYAQIVRDQFDYYVAQARQLADPSDWCAFRQVLHAALVAAWGLEGVRTDRDPADEVRRRDRRLQAAHELIDRARGCVDPAVCWDEFTAALWSHRRMLGSGG